MARSGRLTPRETEVLAYLGAGNTARLPAEILGNTARTMVAHAQSVVTKLGSVDCTHLVAVAIQDGLILPPRSRRFASRRGLMRQLRCKPDWLTLAGETF
jgi:DNA-binding CsgD family transcriptional regulator